ncbi:hypothetical protein M758_8G055300 [Ceratodon purpureus]|nr:hypothetical protein M758_8G055300 [Ceratodon purpureus]
MCYEIAIFIFCLQIVGRGDWCSNGVGQETLCSGLSKLNFGMMFLRQQTTGFKSN